MKGEHYQGWSNYETWCVSLWIDNEEASYKYWRAEARRHRLTAPSSANVRDGIWTEVEAIRYGLADQIRWEITENAPISEPIVYSDLLAAALQEVNWVEIAETLLAELDDSDG